MVHSLVISLLPGGSVVGTQGENLICDKTLIQVCDMRPGNAPDYYDWYLDAPAHEHLVEEVAALVVDLLYSHVEQVGGLQPRLFA